MLVFTAVSETNFPELVEDADASADGESDDA
jgi:hypothetical protein